MVQFSLQLPTKHRIDFRLVKSRKSNDEVPFLPRIKTVLQTKKGNKISRYFRHIFENKRIGKIIGTNLLLFSFVSATIPDHNVLADSNFQHSIESPVVVSTQSGVQYPVENIKITQGYKFYHPGIDLDGITGDPIKPIMAGIVEKIDYSRFAYGNSIIINHGGNVTSLYAHLSAINVVEGQEVTKETKIGEMGATGRSFGDHLHLEVIENGKNINPQFVLPIINKH